MNLCVTVEDIAEVKFPGNLAISGPHPKRATFDGCSAGECLRQQPYSRVTDIPSGTPRHTTWFGHGNHTDSHLSTVQHHFTLINNTDFTTLTCTCTCTDAAICAYAFQLRGCHSDTDSI